MTQILNFIIEAIAVIHAVGAALLSRFALDTAIWRGDAKHYFESVALARASAVPVAVVARNPPPSMRGPGLPALLVAVALGLAAPQAAPAQGGFGDPTLVIPLKLQGQATDRLPT